MPKLFKLENVEVGKVAETCQAMSRDGYGWTFESMAPYGHGYFVLLFSRPEPASGREPDWDR